MTTAIVTPAQSIMKSSPARPAQRTLAYRTISQGKMTGRFNRHAAAFRF